jgi:hypothetical protein
MKPTASGESYGSAQLVERQMLFQQVREAARRSPAERPIRSFKYLTISRRIGSLGDALAQEVAGSLGWHICDREIVDYIAQNSHVRLSLVSELDEKAQNMIYDRVQRLLQLPGGDSFGIEEYHEALLKTLTYMAARGKLIIIGRGSNFVLRDDYNGLHIRITAPKEVRAQRLSKRWNVSIHEARNRLRELDDERREFVREHFSADIDDPHAYDLVFDTNRLTVHQVASAILTVIRTPVYSDEADVGH